MALTLPIPSSPSSGNSSVADSPPPQTPVSPTHPAQTLSLPSSDAASASSGSLSATTVPAKRKPSRRANTAERRATHNAVERQRRETLNGRFLDLAALLPNLSQIRRPSKSAIVNSSIAHIHASRRHRAMASRETRLLKLEADALRRELNEWRDRANLPRVEEPVRSDAFAMVLNGEVEVLTSIPGMEDEDEEYGDNEDDAGQVGMASDDVEEMMAPFSRPIPPQLPQILPRPSHSRPSVAQNLPSVSFENPAMTSLYDHIPTGYQMQYNAPLPMDNDKSSWNNQIFAAQQLQQQLVAQHGLFSPSAPQFFADGSRNRSSSMSRYGSPGSVSSTSGSYEMPGVLSSGLPSQGPRLNAIWSRDDMASLKGSAPIAVGSGRGNGNAFSMLM
ncbi:hypothetical protein BV25DRAFT_1424884 [Artomyces pyxidatus]|uniref:Uncharacterized protein n=1 Tax=Artomyces pyxidatus TaxID=48021 RepID=A0ACB8TEC5_9AGAM|nr:hypothetical protein BV25DRAFT_1424884 [Artomyces pyxidatus]